MAEHKRDLDGYLGTVERLEPNIHPVDAAAYYASAAISQKRTADALCIIADNLTVISGTLENILIRLNTSNM